MSQPPPKPKRVDGRTSELPPPPSATSAAPSQPLAAPPPPPPSASAPSQPLAAPPPPPPPPAPSQPLAAPSPLAASTPRGAFPAPNATRTPLPTAAGAASAAATPLPITGGAEPRAAAQLAPESSVASASTTPVAAVAVNEALRELAPYAPESLAVESTHIDRDVRERARAMVADNTVDTPSAPFSHLLPPRSFEESIPGPLSDVSVPGFSAAMVMRVRFAGGEVPLWSLVAPLIALAALAAAFAVSAVSKAPAQPSLASDVSGANTAASGSALAASSSAGAALSAAADPAATPDISAEPEPAELVPGKYESKAVMIAAKRRAEREVRAAHALVAALDRDPGLVEEAHTAGELRRLTDNPETARIVLEAVAALPAPVAADLLYEIWTGTAEKTETTELARTLLYSRDVRPKASAALSVALDLRIAQTCAENQAILPRAQRDGDRRALHLLVQLQRRYGCGPNRRQDCNACLRGSDDVDNAIKAVRGKREPRVLGRR